MLFKHTSITFSLIDILQENIVDGVTTGVTAVTAIDEEDLKNNNSGKHFKSSDEGLGRNSATHIQMALSIPVPIPYDHHCSFDPDHPSLSKLLAR